MHRQTFRATPLDVTSFGFQKVYNLIPAHSEYVSDVLTLSEKIIEEPWSFSEMLEFFESLLGEPVNSDSLSAVLIRLESNEVIRSRLATDSNSCAKNDYLLAISEEEVYQLQKIYKKWIEA